MCICAFFRMNVFGLVVRLIKIASFFYPNQISFSVTADTEELEPQKQKQDIELHHKQLFSKMKQDLVQNINFLEKIFDEQNTEIKKLREELQKQEHQLQSVQQEAQAMQKRLHEEVEYLQKEKEKLIMSCKAEKEEASQQRRHVSALQKELEV